jgi:DNA-binding response OmpR family regulator
MENTMPEILVIEDDNSIRCGLVDTLRAKGYAVRAAERGADGLALFRSARPDLVLLDLMLPDLEGFEVCRLLKTDPGGATDVPVIILTARGSELDRVRGLELGADDYVTKPFSLMELLARVTAVLRRCQRGATLRPDTEEIRFGDVRIDFRRHVGEKAGASLELSDRAYLILAVFARHRGAVLSREQLLEEAWGYSRDLNTRTVDNHVVKIRQQIEDDPNRPRYLVTVHGVGYKLAV